MYSSIQFYTASSLEKVFPEERPASGATTLSCLKNEVLSLQLVVYTTERLDRVELKTEGFCADKVTVGTVGLVNAAFPCYDNCDDYVLFKTPRLCPDPILPIGKEGIDLLSNKWQSIWVTINGDMSGLTAGSGRLTFTLMRSGEALAQTGTYIEVIDAELPEQSLICTHWFHYDCIANYYNCEVWSDEHKALTENFIKNFVAHGCNMLLTPLFTPPLDTDIGLERRTAQLVDVYRNNGEWSFCFDRLDRFMTMAEGYGVKYFELCHLFTQWGSYHAPKIIASVDGGAPERVFGWETDSHGEEYTAFLRAFVPQLIAFCERTGRGKKIWFHVSDEPVPDNLDSYMKAAKLMHELTAGYPSFDALSHYEFYEQGLVKIPVCSENHIKPFLENHVSPLWTYYCCGQGNEYVSNRFLNQPLARDRVLGVQLWRHNIQGFLQWGYNFYNGQHSRCIINPWETADGLCTWPAGDPFVVYPGKEGCLNSIRYEVFREALQDLRAMQLLEAMKGRAAVMAILEKLGAENLDFSDYPQGDDFVLTLRRLVNAAIAE